MYSLSANIPTVSTLQYMYFVAQFAQKNIIFLEQYIPVYILKLDIINMINNPGTIKVFVY